MHVVIVGGGHAAAQLVTSFRMKKFHENGGRITLISDEPDLPYQRPPLSKAYLKGDWEADRLPILRETAYDSAAAERVLGTRVSKIERATHEVVLEDGRRIAYDRLVLATGGHARALPVPGADDPRVFDIRTRSDVDRLKPAFEAARRVGVIGGGYIGLEAASVAAEAGKHVVLFEAEERILARVVAPQVSQFYHALHSRHGVEIHTESRVTRIGTDPEFAVVTADGASVEVDLILVGIGLIPNTALAEEAGLACDRFGIEIDAGCRTSDPDIFAVGDVTSFEHPMYGRRMRLESVPNAVDQAKVAVEVIMGQEAAYETLPWFWSDQYGLKLQIAGLGTGADTVVTRGDPMSDSVAFFYLREGRLIAADCAGRVSEFMAAKKLITAGIRPDVSVLADESRPFKEIAADMMAAAT